MKTNTWYLLRALFFLENYRLVTAKSSEVRWRVFRMNQLREWADDVHLEKLAYQD